MTDHPTHEEMLDKFYTHVEQRIKDHPILGQPVDFSKYEEN